MWLYHGLECAQGLGSCCHKDSQLLITDILFLPGPISEAQAQLRYHCFPPPIPGTEACRPSTPKGLGRFVAQLKGPGPCLSARLSRGSGMGCCLTLGGTLQPGKNLFRVLARCPSWLAFLPGSCPSLSTSDHAIAEVHLLMASRKVSPPWQGL